MLQFCPYELVPASFNAWRPVYLDVAKAVITQLADPRFEFIHFGSSSFKVAGKGIIDISILYHTGAREQAVEHLESFGFVAQHSDTPFPDTRPRKDIGVLFKGEKFNIHAHVIELNSAEHQKQLTYKTHMLANPQDRAAYEAQKKAVLAAGKHHQDEYGKAKSPFVKDILSRISPQT
ncbi:GrpB family protein [Pseudoalteromonas luteoviolacea]|uniref:GrpB family protein n=1 Tax=Pseudoalteromonas luteoviolacea TaxID=43657 RepID=UPI001B362F44|nr:GrpB family protein [Pseudoalteromonas luteoviolacea]MBQ4811852.1 GrpB family protein [Pseudoalteromonas luteoviolacea]